MALPLFFVKAVLVIASTNLLGETVCDYFNVCALADTTSFMQMTFYIQDKSIIL